MEINRVLSSLSFNDTGFYLRDGPIKTDIGIAYLHPSKGTHWVCYVNENYFDSYGCVCPKKLSTFIIKRYGPCLYSEYKRQGVTTKRDIYYAKYCLYVIYLTKFTGLDFKNNVLNTYYQMIKKILMFFFKKRRCYEKYPDNINEKTKTFPFGPENKVIHTDKYNDYWKKYSLGLTQNLKS